MHKTQATVSLQQDFPNSVGMAAAVDRNSQVCTRPVTQRRWCALIPSSPFPKHSPSLLKTRNAACLILAGYSCLSLLGSAAFPMLLHSSQIQSSVTHLLAFTLFYCTVTSWDHVFSLLSFLTYLLL